MVKYLEIIFLILNKLIIFQIYYIDYFISLLLRRRTFKLQFSIAKKLTTSKYLGQEFVTRTQLERQRTVDRFTIESDLTNFIDTFAMKHLIFWDIGSCVGNFSIYAARKSGTVISIEPDLLTYSTLIQNVYNSKMDNIETYPFGLFSTTGINKLNMKEFNIAGAYNSIGRLDHQGKTFTSQWCINIQTYSAMDLIEKNNIPIPNFIKLDVDGNELAVLQGFGDHLSDIKMKGIIIELDVYNPESKKSVDLLWAHGFRGEFPANNLITSNYIFLKESD